MSFTTPELELSVESGDAGVERPYEEIQQALVSMGHPSTSDRTSVPQSGFTDKDVTIACLCDGANQLSLLLESGRHCPGDMILVLSPSWFKKISLEGSPANARGGPLTTLFVKQGLSCDKGGNTYYDKFEPPRRVTYLLNSSFDLSLEKSFENVDCPSDPCPKITEYLMDTISTRILMAHSGINVPTTLAFPFNSTQTYDVTPSVSVCPIVSREGFADPVRTAVIRFLGCIQQKGLKQVVVKLCGRKRKDVVPFQTYGSEEVDGICAEVNDVIAQISDGEIVFIEALCNNVERVEPLNPYAKVLNGFFVTTRRDQGVRIEATVCRNPEDEAILTSVVSLVGEKVCYLKNDQVYAQSLDDTLRDWGITSEEKQQSLKDEIKSTCERILKMIMCLEESLCRTSFAKTDFIGVDFVLTIQNGRLVPVPVDVKCQNEASQRHQYDVIHSNQTEEVFRPLLATMVTRSMRYILKGKRIAVLGAGYLSKKFIWEAAKQYGIEICLLDCDPVNYALDMVNQLVHFDFSDHTKDREHSKAMTQLLEADKLSPLDGCLTFWEDCVPLTAMICEELSLKGAHAEAAAIAKSKSRTQQFLQKQSNTSKYVSSTYLITKPDDIEAACKVVTFPAIMKPEFGTGSLGVKLVDSMEACYKLFYELQNHYECMNYDVPGVCHGESMLVMDYVDGPDYVVDLVMFDKKLVGGFMHDKGPTRLPGFTKVSSCFPTRLPTSKVNQVIFAAYQCCLGVGLQDGIFNVDMRMSATGPKLIEINARPGGYDLRDCIKKCYMVDIALLAFAIACGIRPRLVKQDPIYHVMSLSLTPSDHGHAVTPDILKFLRKLNADGPIIFNEFQELASANAFEEPFCSIVVTDKSFDCAKIKLTELGRILGLDSDEFPISYCLSTFK